jgi:Methionyl-tRNA formyltransferase
VTTFFLQQEIDTGAVIMQESIPVLDTDNAGTIHDKLMNLGAELVVKTVGSIIEGNVHPVSQDKMNIDPADLKPAPKIFKDTCRIDWSKSVNEVYNFIRGLSPYPGAWTELEMPNGKSINLKIFETEKIIKQHALSPGTPASDGKTYLDIAAPDGFIRLKQIQQAGKKRMTAEEYLRGNAHLF